MGYWEVVVPEAVTNLLTNPSFETGTTGWAASGSNTIAQSSDYSLFGHYGLKATYQDSTTLATFSGITLTAANHTFTAYIYLPSNWDGGAVRLAIANFTSVTTDEATTTTTTTGQWARLRIRFTPDSGDLTGDLIVECASAPTAGRFIYIDAAQCEQAAYETTYLDGDQPGGQWQGAKHASTSKRKATSTEGGRPYALSDLGFTVEEIYGAGMPPVQHLSIRRAMLGGEEYQGAVIRPRVFRLRSTLSGSTQANYHAARRTFINAIRPDDKDQAYIFRYNGAGGLPREIRARYDRGLELRGPAGFSEPALWVQFIAHEPYFERLGNQSEVLDVNDSATSYGTLARIDRQWSSLSTTAPATAPEIYCAAISKDGGTVYFGGSFTDYDGVSGADYIVAYDLDSQSFGLLGSASDINGHIRAIKIAPSGDVYIVGDFTNAGAVAAADYIAYWNGSSWNAVGTPNTGAASIVGATTIDFNTNGDIYVGFVGTNWADIAAADCIAKWNGSSWGAIGTNQNNSVLAAEWGLDGKLYIGGDFLNLESDSSADYIARYNPDTDEFESLFTDTLSHPVGNTFVSEIVRSPAGDLYICGQFDTLGSKTLNHIAKFNGQTLEPLGSGMTSTGGTPDTIEKIFFDNDGNLWAFGIFTEVDGLEVDGVAIWNGASWARPEIQNEDYASGYPFYGMATRGDDLFIPHYAVVAGHTVDFSGSATVTNNGSAKAYPVIKISKSGATGTARLANIVNATTGKVLYFKYDLQDGEEVTIDLRPGNRKMVSSHYGNRWAILPGSDVSEFYLRPGDNTVTVFVEDNGTSPSITAFIEWRDTDWSVD